MTDESFDDEEEFDPEEAERSIAEFIEAADELGGVPIADLAAQVLAEVERAQDGMRVVFDGQSTNKIIATMLLLGRQHRDVMSEDTALAWRLSAASTLVSGFIRPGEG